jgi:hypothetical protein
LHNTPSCAGNTHMYWFLYYFWNYYFLRCTHLRNIFFYCTSIVKNSLRICMIGTMPSKPTSKNKWKSLLNNVSAFRNVPKVSFFIRIFTGFNLKYQTHNLKITYNSSEYIPWRPIISYKIYFPLQIPFQILDIPTWILLVYKN